MALPPPPPPPLPPATVPTPAGRGGTASTASSDSGTRFFGSQIGGRTVINYGYTDLPWRLMTWDVYYFFKFFWAIPYILWPLSPADSAELSELSPTRANLWCIAVHLVLCVVQLAGILALPLLVLLPGWAAALLVAAFLLLNKAMCLLLNGKGVEYHSEPKYAPELPEHAHEQWIYINGVAAGSHWMQSNLNRLAVTFKRPILGIHNRTSGIIFDVLECLIQRNWGYATKDVRVCYQIILEKIYNPQYSKVIFVLHSQGGIEGSLIIDWLLSELPRDLLAKLEVYTFGNAANHFNNPHTHKRSQTLAKQNPFAASIDSTRLASAPQPTPVPRLRQPEPKSRPSSSSSSASSSSSSSPDTVPNNEAQHPITNRDGTTTPPNAPSTSNDNIIIPPISNSSTIPPISSATTTHHPSHLSGRVIGHIEHYAHTTDFVALWGVLHFATAFPSSHLIPRFAGRVFVRASPRGGHQMVQHYLDGMFPLRREAGVEGGLVRDAEGVPVGVEENNEFMESEVVVGGRQEEVVDGEGVEVHGSPVLERSGGSVVGGTPGGVVTAKVKELSRLWQYRNGRSPGDVPPLLVRGPDGLVRNATL